MYTNFNNFGYYGGYNMYNNPSLMPMQTNCFNNNMFNQPIRFTMIGDRNSGSSSTGSSSSSQSTPAQTGYVSADADTLKFRQELFDAQEQLKAQKATTEQEKKELEATKSADGTAVKLDKRKCEDVSFTEKAMTVGMSALKGMEGVLKGLVGYGSDGKWHWQNAVRNAVIGAGIALCPMAGAAIAASSTIAATIGATTAATVGAALTAVPTVATVAGCAAGTYLAGKGAYDMATAETMDDLSKGTQETVTGLSIAIPTFGAAKKMIGSALSEAGASATGNIFSRFWAGNKNMTTALSQEMAANIQASGGSFIKGFTKTGVDKYWHSGAQKANESFNNQQNSFTQNLTAREAQLQAKLTAGTITDAETAELQAISNLKTTLSRTDLTKADWTNINRNTAGLSKDMAKQLAQLKDARFKSMWKMEFQGGDQFKPDVQQFGFGNHRFSTLTSDLLKSRYGLNLTKDTKWALTKNIFGDALKVSAPIWLLNGVQGSSIGQFNNMYQAFDATVETGEHLTAEQTTQELAQYDQTTQAADTQISQLQQLINKSYSDPAGFKKEYQAQLAAAQQAAQAQAQAEAQAAQQVAQAEEQEKQEDGQQLQATA